MTPHPLARISLLLSILLVAFPLVVLANPITAEDDCSLNDTSFSVQFYEFFSDAIISPSLCFRAPNDDLDEGCYALMQCPHVPEEEREYVEMSTHVSRGGGYDDYSGYISYLLVSMEADDIPPGSWVYACRVVDSHSTDKCFVVAIQNTSFEPLTDVVDGGDDSLVAPTGLDDSTLDADDMVGMVPTEDEDDRDGTSCTMTSFDAHQERPWPLLLLSVLLLVLTLPRRIKGHR